MNIENSPEQMDIGLQDTTKAHNIQEASRTSYKPKIPSETNKSFKTQVDPFATHLCVYSLKGFKKRKYLKVSIKSLTQ